MSYEFKNAVKYELDRAYTRYEVSVDCYRLEVTDASSVDATINVELILADRSKIKDIELKKSGYYESPIKIRKIRITSAVQSNEWVKIRNTDMSNPPDQPKYKAGADDIIDAIGSIDSPVVTKSGNNINNDNETVTTSATLISAANTNKTRITVQNISSSDVYLGGSSVTTSIGIKLPPDAIRIVETGAAYYGIVASGTADLRIEEELK
jgi:hypothetical protein